MKPESRFALAACAMLLLTAVLALAHHSFDASFDAQKVFQFSGTVTRLEWTNPHVVIGLDVESSDGKKESWSLQGPSPSALTGIGLDRAFFKSGMGMEVCGYPSKNFAGGERKIDAELLTLSSGQRFALPGSHPGKCLTASPGGSTSNPITDRGADSRRLEAINTRYRTVLLKLRRDVPAADRFAVNETREDRLDRLVDELYIAAAERAFALEEAAGEPARLRKALANETNGREVLKTQIVAAAEMFENYSHLWAKAVGTLSAVEGTLPDLEKAAARWAAREKAERESVPAEVTPFLAPVGAGRLSVAIQAATSSLPNTVPQLPVRPVVKTLAEVPDFRQQAVLPADRPVPPRGTLDAKLAEIERVQLRVADLRKRSLEWAAEALDIETKLAEVRAENRDLRDTFDRARDSATQVAKALAKAQGDLDAASLKQQSLVADSLRSAAIVYVWSRLKGDVRMRMQSDLNAAEQTLLDSALEFERYAAKVAETAKQDASTEMNKLAHDVLADVRPAGSDVIRKAQADLSKSLRPIMSQMLAVTSSRE